MVSPPAVVDHSLMSIVARFLKVVAKNVSLFTLTYSEFLGIIYSHREES